jgi:hypothetical protein
VRSCAICEHLGDEPRQTDSVVGVLTELPFLIRRASARLDTGAGGMAHVLLPTCPAHAVELYRGRVPGASMAWRLAPVVA